jgi:hypothetical protein
MFAVFDSDEVIRIAGIRDARGFFTHIPKLLPNHEWIIGIGCYEPDEQFESWYGSVDGVSVPEKFSFQRDFDLNRKGYPRGRAFYLKATPSNIDQLVHLVTQRTSPELFCDHIIGFQHNSALFSFHDAFEGPDFLASLAIPQANLRSFCTALGVTFEKVKNPYSGLYP